MGAWPASQLALFEREFPNVRDFDGILELMNPMNVLMTNRFLETSLRTIIKTSASLTVIDTCLYLQNS